jgi:hypothetical protein
VLLQLVAVYVPLLRDVLHTVALAGASRRGEISQAGTALVVGSRCMCVAAPTGARALINLP